MNDNNILMDLYIAAGQSNCAGRGKMTANDQLCIPNIYSFSRDSQWIKAKHPLHFDKPEKVGYGPGLDFAKQMLNDDNNIGIIPCAVGGTSIEEWLPNNALYKNTIIRTKNAMKQLSNYELKGIIWHQGENNIMDGVIFDGDNYLKHIMYIFEQFRKDFNIPNLPIVIGTMPDFCVKRFPKDGFLLNSLLLNLSKHVKNLKCVDLYDLNHIKGDIWHFDSPSYKLMGERYAIAMKQLINK